MLIISVRTVGQFGAAAQFERLSGRPAQPDVLVGEV
jgi:hypothetical protein